MRFPIRLLQQWLGWFLMAQHSRQLRLCRLAYLCRNSSFFVLTKYFQDALSFQIQKYRQVPDRIRLEKQIELLTPEEILGVYWKLLELPEEEQKIMQELTKEIFIEIQEG